MGMRAKLWSLSGLSTELARNPRTIGRALRDTPPDGRLGRHPAWHMATAVAALARYEAHSDQLVERGYRYNAGNGSEALISAIETAADHVDQLLRCLGSALTVEDRRKILKKDGKVVGALDRAFERQLSADESADLHRPFTDRVMQELLGEISELCELQISWS
jgi:hypothetical protein